MNSTLFQRLSDKGPLATLAAGVLAGALLMLAIPGSLLFRPAPELLGAGQGDDVKYACPMFCTMAPAPGECPVCGMDMEPIYDTGMKVTMGPRDRYMTGVRTEMIERQSAVHRVRALGKIRIDERLQGQITAWVSGRLDRLFIDFTGETVKKGQKIAEIYAPELVSAQEELISAARVREQARTSTRPRAADLLRNAEVIHAAARRRLLLLGMPESTVAAVEKSGKARDHLDILANVGGTVLQKRVNTGDYVKTGQAIFTVVDLGKVWAMLDVFEQDAGSVFLGQKVEITLPSLPGAVFRGPISFVAPILDEKRRVLRVRVELDNTDALLKPGTFVDASILVDLTSTGEVHVPGSDTIPGPVLLVPKSAILDGGSRKLAYVMTQAPGPMKDGEERWPAIYEPRVVTTGFRVGDSFVVLTGLEDADDVVLRGQFLIDSQLQLTGKPSLMIPEASAGSPVDAHAGH